jgi:hypothetical protein
VVFNLPYSRFIQLEEMLLEQKQNDVREQYILQAFGSWLNGAGQKKTFKQFIKHLGLEKKEKADDLQMAKEDQKRIAQRNIENANKILQLDRKARAKKEG